MRILVTSAGSTAAQNLISYLAEHDDCFVVAGDMQREHGGSGLAHLDLQLPAGSSDTYVEALRVLVNEHRLDFVIPVFGPELISASREVTSYPWLLVASTQCISWCLDKRLLAERLDQISIPQPLHYQQENAKAPVFIRPFDGTGSVGARVIHDEALLQRTLELEPDLVVSQFIAGPEFSVDGFAENGQLVHAICRSRDEVKGGLAVRSTVVKCAPYVSMVQSLCSGLGLHGFFNLQFRLDQGGMPRVFDVNPRLGGAMALSFAAGLDAVGYLRARASGQAMPTERVERVGMSLLRRWHNIYVTA